jgi:zinc protease
VRHHARLIVAAALLSLLPSTLFAQAQLTVEAAPATQPFVPVVATQQIDGGYAIVISKATQANEGWAKVVDILKQKYGNQAKVITWDKSVDDTKPALSVMLPRYTCFVTTPKEASREFVAQVHRLTRQLNDDPYPDTIWGILTGLNSADAQRIAATTAPLQVHSVVSTTGVDSQRFHSVFTISDGKEGNIFHKGDSADAITVPQGVDSDRAHSFVDAVQAVKPDLLVTSAHAGERVLEMPWSHGVLLGKSGQVIAVPTTGAHGAMHLSDHGWELSSPNPKVWLAAGNCLIGHIQDSNSMALAMMHSGGVTQMVGYTVTTWYGAGGWGTLGWFQGQPGRFTLAESFFINDICITRRLAKDFPGRESYAVKVYNDEDLNSLAQELGEPFPKEAEQQKDLLGLTWDHDTVAFYGDPAWSAKVAPAEADFDQSLVQGKDGWMLQVVAKKDGPVKAFAFLPGRIDLEHHQVQGDFKDALLTSSYVLADFGNLKAGQSKYATVGIK